MIQNQFISYLLETKDSSLITLNNLNTKYFSEYSAEWTYLTNHLRDFGNIPDKETFIGMFPDFELLNVSEPPSYLISELFRDYQTRQMATSFNKVREYMMAGNLDKAKEIYMTGYENLSSGVALQCVDLFKDISRYDAYEDKLNNPDKYFIKTGFVELDEVLGGWDINEDLVTIVARNGLGKCLEKGTKVLMADGTTKNVEDVKVGDQVQSLNRVNTVLALHNGKSKGYKIIPKIGDSFTVSENHILTLMRAQSFWDKFKKQTSSKNEFTLEDISIEEYLKLSKSSKAKYRLYRPTVDYTEKELKIPPYILGLWLGAGTSCRPELISMDPEIVEEWKNYAKSLGLQCTEREQRNSKAIAYDITSGTKTGASNRNIVKEYLKEYNLIYNKHIPLEYLTGSKEQRLELLAGIIDTDGYFSKLTYEVSSSKLTFAQEIAQLARGLGFKVSKIKTRNVKNFTHYRVNISGNLYEIPSRLARKTCIKKIKNKPLNPQMTTFRVEEVPEIEYYGFMADGDHRYLLADNTLTHNTWILLKCAAAAALQGKNVGIYSGEMSEDTVGYRIDTLIGHISNGAMMHGSVSIKDNYKKFLEGLKNKPGSLKVITPKMINGPAGVSALRAFIEKEKLDILFVDQHSLLDDDRGASNPVEKASNISKDLKLLQTVKRIPIICVSQQNREKLDDGKGNKSFDTTQVAQSDRIAQDSSVVIFLERKEDLLKLHLVKSRNTTSGIVLSYIADFNMGNFIFVPEEENNKKENDKSDMVPAEEELPVGGTEYAVSGENVF